MKKSINPQAIEIQRRFFSAINHAIESGILDRGLKGFCSEHNLNRTKYASIKSDLEKPESQRAAHSYKIIDIDALAYLCNDCRVSPEWLLFGRGEMVV